MSAVRREGETEMRTFEHFPNLVTMFFARAAEKGDAPFLWAKIDKHGGRPAGARRRSRSRRSLQALTADRACAAATW